jgi:hypothetical protein
MVASKRYEPALLTNPQLAAAIGKASPAMTSGFLRSTPLFVSSSGRSNRLIHHKFSAILPHCGKQIQIR